MLPAFISCLDRLPAPLHGYLLPWELTEGVGQQITASTHVDPSARLAGSVVIDGPVRVGARCVIGPGTVLRAGVWLDDDVKIGPPCEIKATLIFRRSVVAHLSYVGNSVLGEDVNLEAGSVLANHWNERGGQEVTVRYGGERVATGVSKFGALVGDGSRVGANAVTSPGTLLSPNTVVPRLGLVDQS